MTHAVQLMFDEEILIGIPLSGYRLVPGTEGTLGLPSEAFLRLYAINGLGTVKRIEDLKDVLVLVEEVRSEKEALQLLRVETAPETHFLFPSSRYLDIRVCRVPQFVGDVTESAADIVGYRPPFCISTEDGFRVTRDLIRLDADNVCILVRRTEHLSRVAAYSLLEEISVGKINCADIILPDYE